MKRKTSIALVSVVVLIAAGVAGYYFLFAAKQKSNSSSVATTLDAAFGWKFPTSAVKLPSTGSASGGNLAYSSLPDPGGIPSGLPITLQIPVIGVDSAIEDALITPDGRMDVPAGTIDVAWFALGPQPGSVGSAVIGGHYGIQNGIPFVFYNLNKLKIGDDVYVTNDEGVTFTFVVRSIASYGLNADATTVFTSTDGLAHLNLITCEGIWNEVDGNYPDRLVVFTDLVPTTGPIPAGTVSAASTSAVSGASRASATGTSSGEFTQSLGIGSSGAEVTELQMFLEERGLLELPPGVINGFFGTITSAALAKYQTSVGLPSVGVLGPLTIAELNSEQTVSPVLPDTGITGIAVPGSVQTSPLSSPVDGFITLVLIFAIVFMIFKIIRK